MASVLDPGDLERFFPPQPVTCYDKFRPHSGIRYSLSQTEAEYKAGVPYVHLTQTKVEYEPGQDLTPPNLAEKIKWQKNKKRPPVFKFDDEVFEEKIHEIIQKQHVQAVAINKEVKKREKKKHGGVHEKIMANIGPDWYMELSNKQFCIADNLKYVLLMDHKFNTIANTQKALTELGLVLRPNHTCIEYAIKKFYKCPVEFLLTLFKITNPNRKKYSVNDKILLSCVVHLTIRDTLKELHLRIPSPPRTKEKKKRIQDDRPKYDKSRSPYLQDFYFNKQKTIDYIYKNRHKEYPFMEYFNYTDEMYEMVEDTSVPVETLEKKLELKVVSKYAQPPKIPVRLITRIKPKPKMLKRMIKPSEYESKCNQIDLDMEKNKGKFIRINTKFDMEKFCNCPDVEGIRDYTLQVKISTATEMIQFEQDISPFDKKKPGKIRMQNVIKKQPPEMNREEPVTVFASIKQKNPCVCRINNVCKYGQGDICTCYRPEEEVSSEETVTDETSETTTSVEEESVESCIDSNDPEHVKDHIRDCFKKVKEVPETCICSSSDESKEEKKMTLQEELDAMVCPCGAKLRVPSHCICSSESESVDDDGCICNVKSETPSEVSYDDLDTCECFGEKKKYRNEDGCTCSYPMKKKEKSFDFYETPLEKTPGCTCVTGDGAAKRVCKCLEDPANVCFCAEKLNLCKVCKCSVPNMAYVRNIPEDLCQCNNPDLEKINKWYRCTCMGVPQPPAPPCPKTPRPVVKKKKRRKKEKYIPPCLRDEGEKKECTGVCTCGNAMVCTCKDSTCTDVSPTRSFDDPVPPCTCDSSDQSLDDTKQHYKKKLEDYKASLPPKKKKKRNKHNIQVDDKDEECVCDKIETIVKKQTKKSSNVSPSVPPSCSPGKSSISTKESCTCDDVSSTPRNPWSYSVHYVSSDISPDYNQYPHTQEESSQSPPGLPPCVSPGLPPGLPPSIPQSSPPSLPPCPAPRMVADVYSSKYEQGVELQGKDMRQKQLLQMYLKSLPKPEPPAETPFEPLNQSPDQSEMKPQKGILHSHKLSELQSSTLTKTVDRKSKEIHFGSDYRVIPLVSNDSNDTEQEVELDKDACKCQHIFKKYLREHDECIALYDEYQFQVYQKIEEYFEELKDDHTCTCIDIDKYPEKYEEKFVCTGDSIKVNEKVNTEEADKISCEKGDGLSGSRKTDTESNGNVEKISSSGKVEKTDSSMRYQIARISSDTLCELHPQNPPQSPCATTFECGVECSSQEIIKETDEAIIGHCDCLEMLKDDDGCICLGTDSDEPPWDFKICDYPTLWPCVCDKSKKKGKDGEKKKSDEKKLEPVSSKIFNLTEFPKKYAEQIKLLKLALGALAHDNYPLAKLPNCHLLPHFKLWLNLRSKRYISMKEREKMNEKSKGIWFHTQVCQRKITLPDLHLTASQIKKMTWKAYKKYHRMINNVKEDYYRKLKQGYIDESQEYYTTLYHHELYNKTFRDVFFAYLPSDENHIFVINPWQRHEVKDLSRRIPCN